MFCIIIQRVWCNAHRESVDGVRAIEGEERVLQLIEELISMSCQPITKLGAL